MKKLIGVLALLVFSSATMAESYTATPDRIFAGDARLTVERLSQEEMTATEGEFAPLAAVGLSAAVGATINGYASFRAGGSVGQIAASAALGAAAGATGALAATTLVRGFWARAGLGTSAVGMGVGASMVGG